MSQNTTTEGILIRELESHADYDACLALQRATWGHDFRELVPPAMLMIVAKVGGVVAGAFERDGTLAGFVFGLTGLKDARPVHWSHMLAVREDLRDQGIGRRLKLYQRDRLRAAGVERVFWTFDPLVARNAHFNLNRLGARVTEYVPDMYGSDPMSRTDSVIGTDRFIVAWDIGKERDRPTSPPPAPPQGPIVTADVSQYGSSAEAPELPDVAEVRVEIPEDIQSLQGQVPPAAGAWRATTRRALLHYLSRGYVVRGLIHDANSGRRFYAVRRAEAGHA